MIEDDFYGQGYGIHTHPHMCVRLDLIYVCVYVWEDFKVAPKLDSKDICIQRKQKPKMKKL